MFLKAVQFDDRCYGWASDRECNVLLIRLVECRINDLLRLRGYVYLNTICEELAVGWSPEDDNPCIIYDGIERTPRVRFETYDGPNCSLLINIYATND